MMKVLTSILLLLISTVNHTQNISGNLQDIPFNAPLEEVSVTLKDNTTGQILGTDSTDISGNYNIDYVIVGVNELYTLPDEFQLSNAYPNPFNPSTRINFSTPVQGVYTARIYNIIGQLVYNKDITIDAGNYLFNISGLGSAGVYLFSISGEGFTNTQKLVLLDGGSGKINVELTTGTKFITKKSSTTELLIEFRKAGYVSKDIVVNWMMNLNVDSEIFQIPTIETKTIVGTQTNQQTGEPVKNATYFVKKEGGVVLRTGQLNSSGQINEPVQVKKWYWSPTDSTITDIDSLVTVLNKDLYNQKTYSKKVTSSSTVDITGQMVHQGRMHTFTFRNYDVSGFDIDSLTVMLVTPDGNFPIQQQNNNIPVAYTEYHDDSVTEVQMKNLNQDYLQWVSVLTTDQYINYLFQSIDTNWPPVNDLLKIPLNVAEAEGTMEAYWVPARVEHPYVAGQFISMDSDTVKSMIEYSDFFTSCFRSIPARDSVYRFAFTKNQTTGNDVSQANMDVATNTYNLVNGVVRQLEGNGKTAVKTTPINLVTGPEDPLFVDTYTLTNNNFNYIYFEQIPTPGNNVQIAYPEWRIKKSLAKWAEGIGWPTMFEEIYSSLTHTEDPFTGQSQISYLLTNGQPSDLSKKMANLVYIFKPGSVFE